MKSINIIKSGGSVLAGLLLFQSCNKELEKTISEKTDLTNTAQVQVYNAMVGSNRNYVYADGAALNGATIAYGASFPTSAYSFTVPAGLRAFVVKDTLTTSTQLPLAFAENFQSNKNYTIFTYDTITAPKQITVATNIEYPTDTTARVRFANFVYSVATPPAVDIWSVKRQANVFSGIIKTQVTPFIPFASALNDTLLVRVAGTTTQLAALNGFNPTQKRSYTLVYRGGVTKVLASFTNR